MNKSKGLMVLTALVCSQGISAHEVWVDAKHTHAGEQLQAAIGYGHFPKQEKIAADRVHIFTPMQLKGKTGVQKLKQQGENYQYVSKQPVSEGSYLLLATYQPTFWSENAAGWKQQSLLQMPDAKYCEQSAMYGKHVLNVGHGVTDNEVITRPVGQMLEIVPLKNPQDIQVGERFPIKILFKGEPVSGVNVVATFAGFTERPEHDHSHALEAQAFSHQTNAQGELDIIPLREGYWKAKVSYKTDYPEQTECQKLALYSTLTFHIGSEHAM